MGKRRILIVMSTQAMINDELRKLLDAGTKVTFSNQTAEDSETFMKFVTVGSKQDADRLAGLEFHEIQYRYKPRQEIVSFLESRIRIKP